MLGFAKSVLGDVGKAFSSGFDLPSNITNNGAKALLGGIRPHIGGMMLGAAAGMTAGARLENVDPVQSTAVGAAAGAAALPLMGLAGAGLYGAASGIVGNAGGIAAGIGGMGASLGRSIARGATTPAFAGNGVLAGIGNSITSPVSRHAKALNNISGKFASFEPAREVYNASKKKMVTEGGFKIGALGWGVMAAGAAIGAVKGANDAATQIRMGQRDGQVTRATPSTRSYMNNAGASGDLVFALNANRRG